MIVNNINDGGSAFPQPVREVTIESPGERVFRVQHEQFIANGMSLRDYFAGQVLPEVYAQAEAESRPAFEDFVKSIASTAYMLADAMLKARKEGVS